MSGGGAAEIVRIARVGRTHGTDGGFWVEHSIDWQAFEPGNTIWLGDTEATVVERGGRPARPLLRVGSISTREQAAAVRGLAVTAPRSALAPLADGEWLSSDLEGLNVVSEDPVGPAGQLDPGTGLGTVEGILNMPSVDLLDVAASDDLIAAFVDLPVAGSPLTAAKGKTSLLVPMLGQAILAIEPGGRGVVISASFLGLGPKTQATGSKNAN